MSKIKQILIPTDFSQVAGNAVNYCTNLIGEEHAEVTLLHVNGQNGVDKKFDLLKSEIEGGCSATVNAEVRSGELIDEIIAMQSETSSDLIIMGTGGAVDGADETNSSRLVLEVDCPVLVIPENKTTFGVKNIALALGKNEIDDSFALGVLHDIARKFDAKVHVLTICREEDESVVDKNEAVLEYYLETIDYHYAFPVNTDIVEGILDYVQQKGIDMLVILPRNHAKKSTPSEGRLTELLTLHTRLPLLTID